MVGDLQLLIELPRNKVGPCILEATAGYHARLDAKNAMDPLLATSIGVNTDKLLIAPSDSAENLVNMVDTLTKSGSVDVMVANSVLRCASTL
ncbi:DNA recombination and repair protein RecA [Dillenia turbinata]|uniref:DNA recombination and repair protein RecA n=1 Tax=Dillenia turbinata TaxID=194707 RepID=A0AAN8ZPE2_9MAGN